MRAHKSTCWFLAAAILLGACQAAAPTTTPVPSTVQAPATATAALTPTPQSRIELQPQALRGVQVNVWHGWFGSEAELFQAQAAQFNTENQWGIVVHAQPQGNYSALFESVEAVLANVQRPEMVIGLPEQGLAWDQAGALADLGPYLADPAYGLNESELADFPSLFLDGDVLGGRRLGMPAQRTARLLLYNQTWARELGFDAPPAAAEDFQEQACAANRALRSDAPPENDGRGGWLVDANPMTALAWMQAFDGGVVERDSYRFLTHPNVAAFEFIKGLFDKGCAWLPGEETPDVYFASRQALFATASLEELSGQSQAFAQAGSRDEWTVLAFPGSAGRSFMVYGSSYFVLKSDESRQLAAWLFMRWMLSPENQVEWVQGTGLYPLRVSAVPLLETYRKQHPYWDAAVDLLPLGQTPPRLAHWRKLRPMLGDAFLSMFRQDIPGGQLTALLARMDKTAADLMDDE